ncbi:MAG TPA: hypothetical protein VGL38_04895 [bacterium]|jgi:hypothetical protein
MKQWWLLVFMAGAMVAVVSAREPQYATPEAAKFAPAAREVLIRIMSESISAIQPASGQADTMYVAYPYLASPPPDFLAGLHFENVVFEPISSKPHDLRDNYAYVSLRVIAADSLIVAVEWSFYGLRNADGTPKTALTMPYAKAVEASVVRKQGKWEIALWKSIPLM